MTNGMEQVEAARRQHEERLVYDYDVPSAEGVPFQRISIIELTPNEERLAGKRANNEGMKLMQELSKSCLHEVVNEDGSVEKVSHAEQNIEAIWKKLGPKGRSLVMNAYADVHNTTEAGLKGFLKSKRVRTS